MKNNNYQTRAGTDLEKENKEYWARQPIIKNHALEKKTMKHKHYDLILAWANGETIQFVNNNNDNYNPQLSGWQDISGSPSWDRSTEYRIKPNSIVIKYKVALVKGNVGHMVCAYSPTAYKNVERATYFIRWLGDEQETIEIVE